MNRFPFLVPNPPKLSVCAEELRAIEESGRFTNFGPVNELFERVALDQFFSGAGAVTTISNATIGLMLAIRAVIGERPPESRRFAVMPSFTFAATAHAALWCNLAPLFCDIERDSWNPSPDSVRALCERYRDEVALVVPCSTFGNPLDLDPWLRIARDFDVPLVVDAAAALGSLTADGKQFGEGWPYPVVYSLHATKAFATGEAGLVYSSDAEVVGRIRQMSNFGFDETRTATMSGLNGKLSEVAALMCVKKLDGFDAVAGHRDALCAAYRRFLPDLTFQRAAGSRRAYQFVPARAENGEERARMIRELAEAGVETRTYFSPTLHETPFFASRSEAGDLSVTQWLSDAVVSFPIYDAMSEADVERIAGEIQKTLRTAVSE